MCNDTPVVTTIYGSSLDKRLKPSVILCKIANLITSGCSEKIPASPSPAGNKVCWDKETLNCWTSCQTISSHAFPRGHQASAVFPPLSVTTRSQPSTYGLPRAGSRCPRSELFLFFYYFCMSDSLRIARLYTKGSVFACVSIVSVLKTKLVTGYVTLGCGLAASSQSWELRSTLRGSRTPNEGLCQKEMSSCPIGPLRLSHILQWHQG